MNDKIGIFISYRRSDTSWAALAILERITRHFPAARVFVDVASLEPGVDFVEALEGSLEQCDVLLTLIGHNWLTSHDDAGRRRIDAEDDWVRLEIKRAIERKIRVIPVLIDGAQLPKPEHLPLPLQSLSRRQAYQLNPETYGEALTKLVAVLSDTPQVIEPLSEPYSPRASNSSPPPVQVLAELFEEYGADNETLSVLAESQLDRGRFSLGRSIFEIVASRMMHTNGVGDLGCLRAMYQVGRAQLLEGNFAAVVKRMEAIAPMVVDARDESYPLYFRVRLALTRAYMELGDSNRAKDALPDCKGVTFRDQSWSAMQAWLADSNGHSKEAESYLSRLSEEGKRLPPSVEFKLSIQRYLDTRLLGFRKSTMVWQPQSL